jgi:hypothetical protein
MRIVKLLGLMALALFPFAAVTASSAMAEEDPNPPRLLCLVAGCEAIEGTLTAGASELVGLSGKTITGTAAELLFKGCEKLTEETKDVTLCKDVPVHFTGVKREGIACRSENLKAEKDPVETLLLLLDLHMSTESTAGGVLQSLILAKVLGVDLDSEVLLVCGLIKVKEKGWFACLATGLKNVQTTENLEITCKVNATTHDKETGTCKGLLCEELEKEPFQATFNPSTFEDVWLGINLSGKLSKDIFIDD